MLVASQQRLSKPLSGKCARFFQGSRYKRRGESPHCSPFWISTTQMEGSNLTAYPRAVRKSRQTSSAWAARTLLFASATKKVQRRAETTTGRGATSKDYRFFSGDEVSDDTEWRSIPVTAISTPTTVKRIVSIVGPYTTFPNLRK
jgi:hypothetical protein